MLHQKAEIDRNEEKDIQREEGTEGGVKTLPPGDGPGDVKDEKKCNGEDVDRPLGGEMFLSLQQGVHGVDEWKEGRDGEEPAVVLIEMLFEVGACLERLREQEDREEECGDGAEKDEEEKKERLILEGSPAIQDPPVEQQPEEHVPGPNRMNPTNANAPPELQKVAVSGQDPGNTQRDDDRCQAGNVLKRSR